MNWKLIFQLSIFGLVMAVATISLIPQTMEWPFWLAIFIFCAYAIAKKCAVKYFLHGFFVSLCNCFWILLVHLLFFKTFILTHPMASNTSMPAVMVLHPRILMIVSGIIIGIISGLILGLFAFIASKIVKK